MRDQKEVGHLRDGEAHPCASSAGSFIRDYIFKQNTKIFILLESMNSCSLSGNVLAEVCGETLRRILNGEPVSDRYLLGLAWFLKAKDDNENH